MIKIRELDDRYEIIIIGSKHNLLIGHTRFTIDKESFIELYEAMKEHVNGD